MLPEVVKWWPWVIKIVITLKQKGFTKAYCYFWSLYDLTSAGSIFKVLMVAGILPTDRQNDYSNPPLRLRKWWLITTVCCVSGMRKSAMITEWWHQKSIIGILYILLNVCNIVKLKQAIWIGQTGMLISLKIHML